MKFFGLITRVGRNTEKGASGRHRTLIAFPRLTIVGGY